MVFKPKLSVMTWDELTDNTLIPSIRGKLGPRDSFDFKGFRNWMLTKGYMGVHCLSSSIWKRLYHIDKWVMRENQDHFITICGMQGYGKSTLSIFVAFALDPNLSKKNFILNLDDMTEKLETEPDMKVFILDEGSNFCSIRDRFKFHVIKFNQLMDKVRAYNKIFILNMPQFEDVDTYIRQHRTDTLFYIPKKGNGWSVVDWFNKKGIGQLKTLHDKRKKLAENTFLSKGGKFKGDFKGDVWPPGLPFTEEWYQSFKHSDTTQTIKEIRDFYKNTRNKSQNL